MMERRQAMQRAAYGILRLPRGTVSRRGIGRRKTETGG